MHYREYVRATGINLLFTFCIYLYYPILASYIKGLGLDDFQVGLIFSILPLATIFSSPIIGRLADDLGRLKVIILGLIIEIVAMVLYIFGGHWSILAAARLLDAIAISGVTLVALAKIEDSLSNKERGKYAGCSFSLTYVGAIVAPVVGGLMADKFFIKSPFILAAFMLIVLAFMLAFKSKKLKKKVDTRAFNVFDGLKTFLSLKPLKGMAILGIVMHATNPARLVFLPLYYLQMFF